MQEITLEQTAASRPISKRSAKLVKQAIDDVLPQSSNVTPECQNLHKVDWFVINSSGEQTVMKSNGEEECLDSLFVSYANCFETDQVNAHFI